MEAAPPTPTPARALHVLVVPFPAQGHALPLLDLVALLAARGLRLTVVTTPANLHLLSPLLAAHPAAAVRAVTFPFPSHPALPPGLENTRGCGPGQFPTFIHAFAGLRDPVLAWARAQQHDDPVVAVVADFFCGWAQPLAREVGAAGVVFSPSGVLGTAVMHSIFRRLVRRPPGSGGDDDRFPVAFPAIPGEPSFQWRELLMMYMNYMAGALEEKVGEAVRQSFLWNLQESWGFVSNTFRALEGRYLDQPLEDLAFRRVWAVGPVAPTADAAGGRGGGEASVGAADLMAWLDAFPEGSVVYVCFGSQAVLTPPVAAALAEALERSAVPFVWAVGDAVVPEGFEARAAAGRGGGLVVRGWAPQVAILAHSAVGGFLTHCGWGSTLEAVAAGMPMATWPLFAEQFLNERLIVDVLGVGVSVGVTKPTENILTASKTDGSKAEVEAEVGMEQVTKALEKLMDQGAEGEERRRKARELKAKAKGALEEGGSSYVNLENLIQSFV